MLSKPEEVIMAVLAAVWVVLTYFLAGWTGAAAKYVLLITAFSGVWAVLAFLLWKTGWAGRLWPVLAGGLVACWWPFLDWFAVRGIVSQKGGALVVAAPWYASWGFKLLLSLAVTAAGYWHKWRLVRKAKF